MKEVDTMIHGIGIDLIEIQRIQTLYERQEKLLSRILSTNEQQQFHSLIIINENRIFSRPFCM